MNKDALREELAEDEGCRYEIYLDHLQLPTFGIGHLIKEHDPEYGLPVGTRCQKTVCVRRLISTSL
jgi:GH24 family phage-related lysozyme (muramidase)